MTKALYVTDHYETIYGPDQRKAISEMVEICGPPYSGGSIREDLSVLREVEVILSGWGGPHCDEEFLAAAPELKLVLYGAGSVKGIVSDAFWDRGVLLCGAWGANAVAVAEYTLSQVLWCLKHGWAEVRRIRAGGEWWLRPEPPGAFGTTVGIVSLGMVGKQICRLLRHFDVHVLAYDPFATAADAEELGVELCGLDEIFVRSEVVSLHTPPLEETRGMVTGAHFTSMKDGASFINTSRGMVVREAEMTEVLAARPDLQAVLDVTEPEPPAADSPLWTLPNVVLTPHIAGVMGRECNRMGQYMVDELRRYLNGEPLQWQIRREMVPRMA